MRVLHTIAAREWGGIACRTAEQVRWLNAHGHEAWLACPGDSEVARRATNAGVPVISINFDRPFSPSTILTLRRLTGRLAIDIIEAHTGRCANADQFAADLCAIVRARHTTHSLKPSVSRWIRWRLFWHWTVATAETIAGDLVNSGLVPKDRISVVGEWVRSEFFDREKWRTWRAQWRKRLDLSDDVFVVGAVGMLRPEKGFDTLIKAVQLMAACRPDVLAVIVGEAPKCSRAHLEELRRRVVELGIRKNVRFCGYQEDTPGLFQAFDVLAVPSTFEAQSRVIPEAFASETPVVASRIGGITELVRHGCTGWLFSPGDANALAYYLADVRSCPETTATITRTAGELARQCLHIDTKMQAYVTLYENILKRQRWPSRLYHHTARLNT